MEYKQSISEDIHPGEIHPGLLVAFILKKRGIGKSKFAISLQEYPQTFSSITSGKRSMNTKLALKIERALNLREGYLMTQQLYYDIEKIKEKEDKPHPDLSKIRRILFWDTKFEKIDWIKYKDSIIKRVFERGDDEEKNEIVRFYGKGTVAKVLNEKEEALL